MKKSIQITFEVEGTNFNNSNEYKICDILKELAIKFENGQPVNDIFDENGKKIGELKILK